MYKKIVMPTITITNCEPVNITWGFTQRCKLIKGLVEDFGFADGQEFNLPIPTTNTVDDNLLQLKRCIALYEASEKAVKDNTDFVLDTPDVDSEDYNQLANYANFLEYKDDEVEKRHIVKLLVKKKAKSLDGKSEAEIKKSFGLPADFDWNLLFKMLGLDEDELESQDNPTA